MNTERALRSDLRFSSLDCFLFSIMVGAGETFLPAFALAMGSSEITAGLIAALPFLIGSGLQLAAPWALTRVGSYRKWLVSLGLLQGLSFLPLIYIAVHGQGVPDWVFYLVATMYWTCGLASGPAWSAWMSEIVPASIRPQYFAKRNHLGQIGLLLGLVLGGGLLHVAKLEGFELYAFAAVFLVSGISRVLSATCMGQQSDKPGLCRSQKRIPLKAAYARLTKGSDGKLIGFMLFFTAAVHLSASFFNPFMLKKLELSYGPYIALIAASLIAKVGIFVMLSKYGKHMNPFSLMKTGLVGTAGLPLLWIVSGNFYYLICAQILSGAAWALYDLGVMLALFGVIRDEERTSLLSLFNFGSAIMVLLGTMLGGEILKMFGGGHIAYFVIFAVSGAARFTAIIPFNRAVASAYVDRKDLARGTTVFGVAFGRRRRDASSYESAG